MPAAQSLLELQREADNLLIIEEEQKKDTGLDVASWGLLALIVGGAAYAAS